MSDLRHVISVEQFDRPLLDQLFARADQLRQQPEPDRLAGKLLFTFFYEPSTRTRHSFEAAGQRLGMGVVSTENARESSSDFKGESLEDTIRVLNQHSADVIAMRHHQEGAAARAAAVSEVPVINAGDGKGEHPTQSLLDLYTIQHELGGIDGKTVLIGGDLAYGRTGRSFAKALTNYAKVRIIFVAPPEVKVGDDIKQYLKKRGTEFRESEDLAAITEADVVYWTRLQWERFEDKTLYDRLKGRFTITPQTIKDMKSKAILMHPLPRIDEIEPAVDTDPRAAYFRQIGNGLFIRMALLEWVLAPHQAG